MADKKKLDKISMITVSVVFLLILLLSYACPLITDDFHFKYIWNGFDADIGNEVRVSSIKDIFTSAANYYNFSGGRVICHFIVFAMVNMNKWVFAVCNGVMFILAGWLIYKHIAEKYANMNKLTLTFVYLSMFLFLPVWGDSVIWMSGSVNYLWASVPMLWALYLIDTGKYTKKNHCLACIAVLIASAMNEIFGGMLAIVLILRMITHKIKPMSFYYTLLFCVIPGMGLVLNAPGNANRQLMVDGHQNVGILDMLKTAYGYLDGFIDLASIQLFVILVVLFYFIFRKEKADSTITSMTITIASIAGTIALGCSGVVIRRALFSTILPLTVAVWSLLPYVLYKMEARTKAKAVVCSCCALAVLQLICQEFMQMAMTILFLLVLVLISKLTKGSIAETFVPSFRREVIIAVILSIFVLAGYVMTFVDFRNYNRYIDNTVQAMKDGDSMKVNELRIESGVTGAFFPTEGRVVSNYSLSWIYQYYVVDGES